MTGLGRLANPWTIAVLGFVIASILVLAWPEFGGGCQACRPPSLESIPASNFIRVDQSAELEVRLRVEPTFTNGGAIPRIYVTRLPGDLDAIKDVERRKSVFILAILPQILRLNEAITSQRQRSVALWAKEDSGETVSNQDATWLRSIERIYGVDPGARTALLRRMDVIPPSLVVAQASVESGWGTSRFAQQGNALFGQRTFDEDGPGLDPAGLDAPHFKVKRFESVMRSIWGYMLTLNTHHAYSEFRDRRAAAHGQGRRADALELAATLLDYSEERHAYVRLLRQVILSNKLQELDSTRLAPNVGT